MIGRRFWADAFDLDLPKVLPDALAVVGNLSDVELWTNGHLTDGALNHPSVWNSDAGMVAFFGFCGPCRPEAYWTGEPLVRCTVWEAIRDVWAHHLLMAVEGEPVWNSGLLWPQYETVMAEVRGWPSADAARARAARASVRVSLHTAVERLKRLALQNRNRIRRFDTAATGVPSQADHHAHQP